MTGWWWYPFVERITTDDGRAMRAPTRAQLARIAELEAEYPKDVLYCAVFRFLRSRDNEPCRNEDKDPWAGVDSMWNFFLSDAQLPVWVMAGQEERDIRAKHAASLRIDRIFRD